MNNSIINAVNDINVQADDFTAEEKAGFHAYDLAIKDSDYPDAADFCFHLEQLKDAGAQFDFMSALKHAEQECYGVYY